jgi:hypothetical protein
MSQNRGTVSNDAKLRRLTGVAGVPHTNTIDRSVSVVTCTRVIAPIDRVEVTIVALLDRILSHAIPTGPRNDLTVKGAIITR